MPHRSRKTLAAALTAAASLAFTGLVVSAPASQAATTLTTTQFSPWDDGDDEDTVCDGVLDWTPEGFYRSGTTVHYGDHLWQTSQWVKGGEAPHDGSPVWTKVADCGRG
ncbi:hypothetical protein [Streptomyces sp. NPDC088757]|uniref:hypothetical protein n=1 Tax=Streptomyces sp. NPDC088757 TaxID=3365889 RepID=UPI0037F12D2C